MIQSNAGDDETCNVKGHSVTNLLDYRVSHRYLLHMIYTPCQKCCSHLLINAFILCASLLFLLHATQIDFNVTNM